MKEYIVQKHLDYLTFTSHKPLLDKRLSPLYQYTKSPIANYDIAKMYRSGMLQLESTRDERVGIHFICSGSCLAYMRSNEMDERNFLQRVLEIGQISRIDIAITSFTTDTSEHELQPAHIVAMCARNELKSRLKPAKEIAKNFTTETKYIGNQKTRRRLFRAYDKGLDEGGEAGRIVRFELETRRGGNIIGRAVRDGVDIGALMRRYVDFPSSELWLKIMDSKPAEIKHEAGEITIDAFEKSRLERVAKWQWLNESIAPMLRKLLLDNEQIDDISKYENEYLHEFKKLSGIG